MSAETIGDHAKPDLAFSIRHQICPASNREHAGAGSARPVAISGHCGISTALAGLALAALCGATGDDGAPALAIFLVEQDA
jgi:hypothetical protein